jgi:hypothetical protein
MGLVIAMTSEVCAVVIGAASIVVVGGFLALIVSLLSRRTSQALVDLMFAPIEATEDVLAPAVGRFLALQALGKSLRR